MTSIFIGLKDDAGLRCIFPISHDELVEEWNKDPTNPDLTIIENGDCEHCWEEGKSVIGQVGADRFGVKVGFCFDCLEKLPQNPVHPFAKIEAKFQESKLLQHEFLIAADNLTKLFNKGLGSANERKIIEKILASPAIYEAIQRSTRPHQCKICLGIRDIEPICIELLNNERRVHCVSLICVCCKANLQYKGDNCSVVTCNRCSLANSKICAYCMDGAIERNPDGTLYEHNLVDCSRKRSLVSKKKLQLPLVRQCEC